jgi:hypothetical protein
MKREDEILNKIFKSLDVEIIPPEGTKEKIFATLSYKSKGMSFYYSFIRLTIPLSILLTVLIGVEAH